jgi:beta-xylosidase
MSIRPALISIIQNASPSIVNNLTRTWAKTPSPIFAGPANFVSDPSVIKDGSIYRMAYMSLDVPNNMFVCTIGTSSDGLSWTAANTGDSTMTGRAIIPQAGQWDNRHDTPYLIKFGTEYLLYFIGYSGTDFFSSTAANVGLAVSTDGNIFSRTGLLNPVLAADTDGSISSPAICQYNGSLVMLYSSWAADYTVNVRAATSTDGRTWVKTTNPILTAADFPNTIGGIAEVDIKLAADGQYYLFYSTQDDNNHHIGIARSGSPFGPWQINQTPIILGDEASWEEGGVLSPSVLFENSKARLWFHGFTAVNGTFPNGAMRIGYAETGWPT